MQVRKLSSGSYGVSVSFCGGNLHGMQALICVSVSSCNALSIDCRIETRGGRLFKTLLWNGFVCSSSSKLGNWYFFDSYIQILPDCPDWPFQPRHRIERVMLGLHSVPGTSCLKWPECRERLFFISTASELKRSHSKNAWACLRSQLSPFIIYRKFASSRRSR